jgi:hypothetical protein
MTVKILGFPSARDGPSFVHGAHHTQAMPLQVVITNNWYGRDAKVGPHLGDARPL